MGAELIGGPHAHQPAGKSGVVEVQLGHLDQALANVRVERGQAEHDEARLQHPEPCLGCWLGDPGVRSERRVVEELAGAAGAQLDEALEGREIADVGERPHIPLEVRCDVGAQPVPGVEPSVEDAGVATREESRLEGVRVVPEAKDLASCKRQQVEHGGSSRQRLADRLEQRKVLRPGQDPASGLRVGVDDALEVGGQFRCALHLVHDCALGKLGEEPARVVDRERPYVGRFQVRVGEVRKQGAAERGLAALAGSGKRHRRELPGGRAESRGKVALDHHHSESIAVVGLIQN